MAANNGHESREVTTHMSNIDFGKPIAVKVEDLPAKSNRGGRTPVAPALEAWLAQIPADGTFELASSDKDGAHGQARVTQLRKIAGADYAVETRAVVPGKRYRIFVRKATANEANGGKATAAKK